MSTLQLKVPSPVEGEGAAQFGKGYKRYALGLMTAVYTLNLVDRSLMILLLQPIKEDLQLSDTQLGLVTGIAFGLFYALLGVPIARRADTGNRVTITACAIGLWSITVMASIAIASYTQLVIARMAAAIGESGCKPPTYSLIGDYFPEPDQRTRALAIYFMGSPLAAFASFLLGGWLNQLYGWRATFFIMGAPGLLLALLVCTTLREPRLGGAIQRTAAPRPLPPFRAVLGAIWTVPACRHVSIAIILVFALSLGLGPWYAAFLVRSHGASTAELGVWFGIIFGLGGVSAIYLGGYAATRWFSGNERGQMRWCAVAIALLLPSYIAFLTVPGKTQALFALIPLILVLNVIFGPTYSLMQRLVKDDMRATMLSLVMLFANLIGMGLGPQIVGALSDLLFPSLGKDSLRYAMLAMSFIALWAAYHFWKVGETVIQDLNKIDNPRVEEGRGETTAVR